MKKKTIGKEYIFTALILFVVLAVTMVLDSQLPGYHIVIKVIKKASVYSLVAVSMNLLNGFTGLFSLGQAGFMLLGAYSYAVLCIPVAKRAGVYQYFDGGIVKFSLPEIFASFLGDKVGSAVGMILALLVGGLIAAFFAYLIGLPVLRLKSDYLAIATLGFAEIMRTIIQWNAIGPLTNASNLLKGYPDFSSATAYLLLIGVFIACVVLLVNSTYGRAFKAIRDDEVAAEAMGINLAHHKRLAFVISSFFAGVGGGMLAMYMGAVQAPFHPRKAAVLLRAACAAGKGGHHHAAVFPQRAGRVHQRRPQRHDARAQEAQGGGRRADGKPSCHHSTIKMQDNLHLKY